MELICSVLKAQRLYSPKESELLTLLPSSEYEAAPAPPTAWTRTKQQFGVIVEPHSHSELTLIYYMFRHSEWGNHLSAAATRWDCKWDLSWSFGYWRSLISDQSGHFNLNGTEIKWTAKCSKMCDFMEALGKHLFIYSMTFIMGKLYIFYN